MVRKLYKGGYKRALTLSFDDGKPQDIRLKKTFDKYGLKCTFNLIGGDCRNPEFYISEAKKNLWDGSPELKEAYEGHEIASHSYSHKMMPELSDEECKFEIYEDVKELEKAFGTKIKGFAAPYGRVDQRVISHLKENGILYARLSASKTDFSLPDDFYRWIPNPHIAIYATDEGKKMISDFFAEEEELPCLYIWGHSYEINVLDAYGFERWNGMRNRWEYVDSLCRELSGHSDTWYATNIEICEYALAMRKARYDDTYIDNPSDIPLFFDVDGRTIIAPPHTRFSI